MAALHEVLTSSFSMATEAWYSHNKAWHLSRDVISPSFCKDSHVFKKKKQKYCVTNKGEEECKSLTVGSNIT